MLPPRYIIGFTGHRSGIEPEAVKNGLRQALADVQRRAIAQGGQAELFGSVAEGSDVICVEVARELDMPLHLILPLPENEFMGDFTSQAARDRSQRQVDIARRDPQRNSVRVAPGENTRPECYFNLAMVMLQSCDVLIAVHNGQPAAGLGGTGDVVAHASTMAIPTVVIDPKSGSVQWDEKVDAKICQDARMEKLRELAKKTTATLANGADATALQACLDKIAVDEGRRFRPSTVRIIGLQGVATLFGALATFAFSPHVRPWLAAIEMILVCMALSTTRRLRRGKTRDRWIDSRFACELLRSLRACVPLLDPLDPLIARHQSEWRRFALSAGLLVQNEATTFDPLELRDRYLNCRLAESGDESQPAHYEKRTRLALRASKVSFWLEHWSSGLAPLFVLVSLTSKVIRLWYGPTGTPLPDSFTLWLLASFLPIVLPLAAGAGSGLRQALDADRRLRRYPDMVLQLRRMRQWLSGLRTPSTIRTAVSRCEGVLLDELEEWRAATSSGVR